MRIKIDIRTLVIALTLPFVAGAVGSLFTAAAIPTWYAGLNKPFFSPPNWLFGPVWSLLYILMGVSLYLVLLQWKKDPGYRQAVKLFLLQLGLNSLWSILFFGLKNPLLAFGEILILWLLIVKNISDFAKINRNSAILLIPYLIWVSFAALLNIAVFYLNRS